MKISTEQKLDNFKNMRSMISDYKKQNDRYPTTDEFVEKLGLSASTVRRYKRVILDEDKKKILEEFQEEVIEDVKDLQTDIKANIKIFKTIRDGEASDSNDKMNAARNLQESRLDLIRIKRDAPEFYRIGLQCTT